MKKRNRARLDFSVFVDHRMLNDTLLALIIEVRPRLQEHLVITLNTVLKWHANGFVVKSNLNRTSNALCVDYCY
jgi:hypothetical protein